MATVAIATLWVSRKSCPGDPPEMVAAWDEWCIEGNWEGWAEACDKALASLGDDLDQHRYFSIRVPFDQIEGSFTMGTVEADRVSPIDGPDALG